jgi:hypothetical protein
MNVQLGILHVLDVTPRAIDEESIEAFMPQFIGREPEKGEVNRALKLLVAIGHVKAAGDLDLGLIYEVTPEGRLRIR